MSYTISKDDVTGGFNTSASDADIYAYIAVASQADACLTANGVSSAIGKQLKILAVRHLLEDAAGGAAIEERAVSGASRKFKEPKSDETSHLRTLRSIDQYGCLMNVISKNPRVQLRSVGRSSLGGAS